MHVFSGHHQLRILLVDDEPSILEVVGHYLRELNFAVTAAFSGPEGLDRFDHNEFDLVITDRAMPEMTGDEFARQIKARAPEIPIVLITGHRGADVDVTRFAGFLPKPFTRTQLLATIEDLVPMATKANLENARQDSRILAE